MGEALWFGGILTVFHMKDQNIQTSTCGEGMPDSIMRFAQHLYVCRSDITKAATVCPIKVFFADSV